MWTTDPETAEATISTLRERLAEANRRASAAEERVDALLRRRLVRAAATFVSRRSKTGAPRAGVAAIRELTRERAPITPAPLPRDPVAEWEHRTKPVRVALRNGSPADALRALEPLIAERERDPALWKHRARAESALGDSEGACSSLSKAYALQRSARTAAELQRERGRLRVNDPRAAIHLPPDPRPFVGSADRALVLLPASLPDVEDQLTKWAADLLIALADAGVEPHAAAPLGFARRHGRPDAPQAEDVNGFWYHRLDLGHAYPYGGPQDAVLDDDASVTRALVRRIGAGTVVAVVTPHNAQRALVGAALRASLGCRFVIARADHDGSEAPWLGPARDQAARLVNTVIAQVETVISDPSDVSALSRTAFGG